MSLDAWMLLSLPAAQNVITDTIRKVMAARSVQNVKSALDIEMTVGQKSIVFMDLVTRKAIGQVSSTSLSCVSTWVLLV